MPPRILRLIIRDLALAAALGAVAVSGEVPTWALVLYGLGLLWGLAQVRPFHGRAMVSAAFLLAAAGGLYLQVARGQVDLVVAACTFAGLVAVQRMLAPSTPRTDAEVFLAGLLCVAGGAALSGELSYAACLFAFCGLAILALGLGIVESHADGAALPYRALTGTLSKAALGALVGGALLFVIFPRLSWNVVGRRGGLGLGAAQTGLSDGVRLSGEGRIQQNPRIVLRATLAPDPGERSLAGYWVAQALDTFDGQAWSAGALPQGKSARYVIGERLHGTTRAHVEFLPAYGSRLLVALDRPRGFANAVQHLPGLEVRQLLVEGSGHAVRLEHSASTLGYDTWSDVPTAPTALTEDERARLLALPQRLDPRTPALVESALGGEADPLEKARRLESFLQRGYAYTLDLPGAVEDPLADFLFHRKAGHCEHFATALAVLLRVSGVPARVITGFYGGERAGDTYVVRAADAHAWTEAYIEGRGFVRLDATPPTRRGGEPNALLDWLLRTYELWDMRWQSSVVDFSARDQVGLARNLGEGRRAPWLSTTSHVDLKPFWPLFAVGLLGVLAWTLGRARGRPRDEATVLLTQVERVLRHQARLALPEGGVEALARTLTQAQAPLAEPVARVVKRYVEARFGGRPLHPAERRLLMRRLSVYVRALQRGKSVSLASPGT
jgi:transglutaminase-like putative cysteine protease